MTLDLPMQDKLRIIQELVPGKQISLAHVIANPTPVLYEKLGLNPASICSSPAIGIMTVSPAETAVICADLATKAAVVDLSFVDRFSGTLLFTGRVADVETAMIRIAAYVQDSLGFPACAITKT